MTREMCVSVSGVQTCECVLLGDTEKKVSLISCELS